MSNEIKLVIDISIKLFISLCTFQSIKSHMVYFIYNAKTNPLENKKNVINTEWN